MVSQDEPAGRGRRIRGDVRLQLAELGRVDLDVRVETGHGGPVPARSDREHGVERPRGKVVLADREEDQCPELVERGVVGKDLQRLVGEPECAGIVAGAEGSPRRVELREGGAGDLVGGRGRLRVDGLTVVITVGGHGHRLRLTSGDGLLDHDRLSHSRFGVVGVRVAGIAPVVERRAEGPGRHPGRGPQGERAPSPVAVVVVAVPVTVGPSLVVAPVRASPAVVCGRANPVARVDADPGHVVLADPPDVDVAPIDRVAATDDRPIADASRLSMPGDCRCRAGYRCRGDCRRPAGYRCRVGCRCPARSAADAGSVIDARAIADAAAPVIDARAIADARPVIDAGRLPTPGRLSMPGDCRCPADRPHPADCRCPAGHPHRADCRCRADRPHRVDCRCRAGRRRRGDCPDQDPREESKGGRPGPAPGRPPPPAGRLGSVEGRPPAPPPIAGR